MREPIAQPLKLDGTLTTVWLVKQLQALLAGHKAARDAHQVALTQIISTQNQTALKLAVCIDRNTAALEECTIELRRIRERD